MAMDIQTLLDLEEIRQLRRDYTWYLEMSDPEKLADLFTEDGVFDGGPWGRMEGQAKIRKGFVRALTGGPQFAAIHAVTNPRIVINGDTAAGTWYLLDCNLREKNTNPLQIVGLYDETYRRVNGAWRIATMQVKFLWTNELGQITEDNPIRMPSRSQ